MKKVLIVIGLVAVVAIGFLILSPKQSSIIQTPYNAIKRKASCDENTNPKFVRFPADPDLVSLISPPIMKVGSGIKSHAYIETPEPVPVYAPIDSTVVTGAKYTENSVDSSKIQYTLFFDVSCNVSYYFDHLIDVDRKIAKEFPEEPQISDTRSNTMFSVDVKAGDLIGYSWSRQFDFGVLDSTTDPALAGYDEYKNSEKAHAVCPLKFYEGDLIESLMQKIGYFDANDLEVLNNLCG